MRIAQGPGGEGPYQPYLSLRDHPRYEEIKRLIEALPPDKMERLRTYINQWLPGECGSEFGSRYTH
ncbi:MAG: hypothetical protein AB1646_14225 [Thermodesulfobacteriota bacterium]